MSDEKTGDPNNNPQDLYPLPPKPPDPLSNDGDDSDGNKGDPHRQKNRPQKGNYIKQVGWDIYNHPINFFSLIINSLLAFFAWQVINQNSKLYNMSHRSELAFYAITSHAFDRDSGFPKKLSFTYKIINTGGTPIQITSMRKGFFYDTTYKSTPYTSIKNVILDSNKTYITSEYFSQQTWETERNIDRAAYLNILNGNNIIFLEAKYRNTATDEEKTFIIKECVRFSDQITIRTFENINFDN